MGRTQLATALAVGKTFDATSTLLVFSVRTDVIESTWFVRRLFQTFGLIVGSLLSIIIAVCVVALLAEGGTFVHKTFPSSWIPGWYPRTIRFGTYVVATSFFITLGVHNLSLLA